MHLTQHHNSFVWHFRASWFASSANHVSSTCRFNHCYRVVGTGGAELVAITCFAAVFVAMEKHPLLAVMTSSSQGSCFALLV
eukprot:5230747-Amphidinium_carterae.1